MHLAQSSFFLALLYQFVGVLQRWYRHSNISAALTSMGAWWGTKLQSSLIWGFLSREGTLTNAWDSSLVCRALNGVLRLPFFLLHWIYQAFKPLFTHSIGANLAFTMGAQVPAAAGWLLVAILVIPYEQWNNAYSLIGFAFLFFLLLAGGMYRRSLRPDAADLGLYAVGFALAVALAVPLSYDASLSSRFFFYHLSCILCVLVIVTSVESANQLVRLAGMAALAAGLTGAMGVVQNIQGVEVNASYVDLTLNAELSGRVFAVFENPNSFGEVLIMLLPLCIALLFGGARTILGRLGALVALGLGGISLIFTSSRASWLGLGVAVLIFFLLWKPKLIPGLALLALVAIPLLPESVFSRFLTIFNPTDSSTASRFPLYAAAIDLITLRPLTGAGLGTEAVQAAVEDYRLYDQVAPFVHAHNIYLQVWLETGLLGIVTFVGAMGAAIKGAVRAVKAPHCPHAVGLVTMGGVSALAGILVCGLADYIWTYPRVMVVFWFLFALVLAGIKLSRRADTRTARPFPLF